MTASWLLENFHLLWNVGIFNVVITQSGISHPRSHLLFLFLGLLSFALLKEMGPLEHDKFDLKVFAIGCYFLSKAHATVGSLSLELMGLRIANINSILRPVGMANMEKKTQIIAQEV